MNQYHIAHLHEQGQDMIIIPLDSSFAFKTQHDQLAIKDSLQSCATAANLRGIVVPVWQSGDRMMFIAPPNWHAFFKSISWNWVLAQRNKTLTCN